MKLTIFSRMVIALLAIFILSMTVSLYAIYQIHKLEDITKSILVVDDKITFVIDLERKLSDLMLSMVGYDKKYIITKDEELKTKFYQDKEAFERNLVEITSVADTEESKNYFKKVNYDETYSLALMQNYIIRCCKPIQDGAIKQS